MLQIMTIFDMLNEYFINFKYYLSIGFWVRHRGFTHGAGQLQTSSSGLNVVCLRVSLLEKRKINNLLT